MMIKGPRGIITLVFVSMAVLWGLGGHDAQAQRYRIFQNMPDLTKADIEFLKQTARQGLDNQPEGTSLAWANPDSGLRGEVTLLRLYERDGQDCRQVMHQVWAETGDHDWLVSRICLQPDGSWKIPPD